MLLSALERIVVILLSFCKTFNIMCRYLYSRMQSNFCTVVLLLFIIGKLAQ